MKRTLFSLLLALLVLATIAAAAPDQVVEEIIARVNDSIVTRSDFQRSKEQMQQELQQQGADQAKVAERQKDALRDLIDQQLLLDKAKDLGLSADNEVVKRLDEMRKDMKLETMEELEKVAQQQGISFEDFKQNLKNQILTQKVISQEVGSRITIPPQEEQEFYDAHQKELTREEQVKLSEILIAPTPSQPAAVPAQPAVQNTMQNADGQNAGANPAAAQNAVANSAQNPAPNAAQSPLPNGAQNPASNGGQSNDAQKTPAPAASAEPTPGQLAAAEQKANAVLAEIKKGAKFEDVARKESDGPTAQEGGDLGYFKRGVLSKDLEDKTFGMKKGEVSDVIRTKQGFVILQVTDHQQGGVPPFKDVEPQIQEAIYLKKLQPQLRQYLTKLREEAYIDIKPGYIDTGASPNQTKPVVATGPAPSGKGLKKKKKLGVI